MTTHSHTFTALSPGSARFRCSSCQVFGYRRGSKVVPMTCSLAVAGVRCGLEAVQANGDKNRNRCAGHAQRRAA
jgi:hypothetical protein